MGHEVFSRDSYTASRRSYGVAHDSGVTHRAEEQSRKTGKLSAIVDPGVEPIRRSLIRMDPFEGKFKVTIGCPVDIEVSCDTTGSMGGEVDTEMRVLPDLYELCAKVLPGKDPQLCLGIFGDVEDRFVMCRPQFEMTADKIVNYLKEMSPQRDGGDAPEDPQYAMFARAFLTDTYLNRIGLKGYHFIITDASMHARLTDYQLKRIFSDEVFDLVTENGYQMSKAPSIETVMKELKKKTHAYVLALNTNAYEDFYDEHHIIDIASTAEMPAAIAAVIGLSEGTLELTEIEKFLEEAGVHQSRISALARSLANVNIGEQLKLLHETGHELPKAGDIFEKKSDLWPISMAEEASSEEPASEGDDGSSMNWL